MSISIPRVQTQSREVDQIQQNIISALRPVTLNPIVTGNILNSVALRIGSNTVNHGLGRKLLGWFLVRQRALANIYDTQDNNSNQDLTLLLTSDQVVTVDIYVF